MRAKSISKKREALAYLSGFVAVAVPGTICLLSTGAQVAGWKLTALIIAEFVSAAVMRAGVLLLNARGRYDELI